jgi:hypothetical protein
LAAKRAADSSTDSFSTSALAPVVSLNTVSALTLRRVASYSPIQS